MNLAELDRNTTLARKIEKHDVTKLDGYKAMLVEIEEPAMTCSDFSVFPEGVIVRDDRFEAYCEVGLEEIVDGVYTCGALLPGNIRGKILADGEVEVETLKINTKSYLN